MTSATDTNNMNGAGPAGRNVLIFTMNFWPEPTGFGPMTADLAEYLAEKGWKVTVLTGFPMSPGWSVYPEYRGRVLQREQRGAVDVRRVWVYVPKRPAGGTMRTWKRVAYDTTLATSGLPVALTLPRQDVIVALCPPLQAGLAALALKRLWGAPVLYWLQDIVPDAALSTGMMREGAVLRIGRRLEQIVYRGVDQIGIISHGFEANLRSKGILPEKMVFLPNWADVARFDSGPDGTVARRELGLTERDFVVMHAGSVAAKQYLENAVQAMKLLESESNMHLLILGEGNALEGVQREAQRLNVSRVRFLPTTVGPAYVGLLRAADLLLINQLREVKDILIPSKLLTYLPSGRPVVAAVHPESEAAHFIQRAGCGRLVEPQAPDKLATAMVQLRDDPATRARMGAAGATFVRQHFDRPVLLETFERTLQDMVAQRTGASRARRSRQDREARPASAEGAQP